LIVIEITRPDRLAIAFFSAFSFPCCGAKSLRWLFGLSDASVLRPDVSLMG